MSAVLVALGVFVALAAVPLPVRHPSELAEEPVVERIDRRLFARLLKADLEHVVTRPTAAWCGVAVAGGLVGALLASTAGFVFGFVLAGCAVVALVVARGDRSPARIVAALPDLLENMASNLRAGSSLRDALRRSAPADGPLAADIEALFLAADNGVALRDGLDEWADRRAVPEVRATATMFVVGLTTGTDLSASCDRAAAVLRQSAGLQKEIGALAAQARASAGVIGLAPVAFLLVAAAAGSSPSTLFSSPVAIAALVGGLLLDAVGLWWMHRIVSGVAQ